MYGKYIGEGHRFSILVRPVLKADCQYLIKYVRCSKLSSVGPYTSTACRLCSCPCSYRSHVGRLCAGGGLVLGDEVVKLFLSCG